MNVHEKNDYGLCQKQLNLQHQNIVFHMIEVYKSVT